MNLRTKINNFLNAFEQGWDLLYPAIVAVIIILNTVVVCTSDSFIIIGLNAFSIFMNLLCITVDSVRKGIERDKIRNNDA